MERSQRGRKLVVLVGTVVTVALAMGIAATSIFGRSVPNTSYGYPYGCDYGTVYNGYRFCEDLGPNTQHVQQGDPIAIGGGAMSGFLTHPGLAFEANVTLDEEQSGPQSPSDFVPVTSFFNITIENLDSAGVGETGPFDPPLELTIEVPAFLQNVPDNQLKPHSSAADRGNR